MYRNICVPLDGSQRAETAIPYAEGLAVKLNSALTLINVSEAGTNRQQPLNQSYLPRIVATTKQNTKRLADHNPSKTGGADAIIIKSASLTGKPAAQITSYADKTDGCLIVMSNNGYSGDDCSTVGSVAGKVIKATKRPILLIRAGNAQADMFEQGVFSRIVVPLNGSKTSEAILPYIEPLARRLNAEIVIFHVISLTCYSYRAQMDEFSPVLYSEDPTESIKERAVCYLKGITGQLKDHGINARYEMRLGSATEEIIKLADGLCANLVAMTTQRYNRFSRLGYHGVTGKIIKTCSSPLLLVNTR